MQSCASQQNPTGGDKDIIPPKLLTTIPADKSLNYNAQKVIFEFDEFITEKELNKELILSPDLGILYTTKTKKNTFTLAFEKPLPDNTTISLHLNKAIVDVTEGNAAQNVNLVFSTGNELDSLSIKGKVTDILNGNTQKQANVFLYKLSDTLDIKKQKPTYLTRTDTAGTFSLENVREGKYRLTALLDKNENLLWDNKEEKLAWHDSIIVLNTYKKNIELKLATYDTEKPFFKDQISKERESFIKYDEGIFSYKVIEARLPFRHKLDKEPNRIKFYTFTETPDTSKTIIEVTDSAGNVGRDTIYINFKGAEEGAKKDKFRATVYELTTDKDGLNPGDAITLLTSDTATLLRPTVTLIYDTVRKEEVKIEKLDPTNFRVKTKPFLQSLKMILAAGTFKLNNDSTNYKSDTLTFRTKQEDNYGSIHTSVSDTAKHFLLQLMQDVKVVKQIADERKYSFQFVPPGNYQLRFVEDKNGNKAIDCGNYLNGRKPEAARLSTEKILLKANWEIENINF